jgi:protein required for attachment to host cells
MYTHIVVADQARARFFDGETLAAPLHFIGEISDPKARMRDRDFTSDKPGRAFNPSAATAGRRGAVRRSSTGGEKQAHRREAELFAHRVADALNVTRKSHALEHVIVVAEPGFLGLLRGALPKEFDSLHVTTVPKDLSHEPEEVIRRNLPEDAFGTAA